MDDIDKSAHAGQPSQFNLLRIVFVSLAAALGGFLFGFDSGVINGTVEAIQAAFGASDAVTGLT